MRDSTLAVVIVVVVGIGVCLGALYLYQRDHLSLKAPFGMQSAGDDGEDEAAPKEAADQKRPADTKTPRPTRKVRGVKKEASVSIPFAEAVLAPHPATKPLPLAADITVGMGRPDLLAAFHKPTLSATGMDRGRLEETYFYRLEQGRQMTIARLQDGRVVSAHMSNY